MLHFPSEKVNMCVTNDQALLATEVVKVRSKWGNYEPLRPLINSGSQFTIISEEAAQILNLTRIKALTEISGVSALETSSSKYKVKLCMKPLNNKPEPFSIKAMKALPVQAINININTSRPKI